MCLIKEHRLSICSALSAHIRLNSVSTDVKEYYNSFGSLTGCLNERMYRILSHYVHPIKTKNTKNVLRFLILEREFTAMAIKLWVPHICIEI